MTNIELAIIIFLVILIVANIGMACSNYVSPPHNTLNDYFQSAKKVSSNRVGSLDTIPNKAKPYSEQMTPAYDIDYVTIDFADNSNHVGYAGVDTRYATDNKNMTELMTSPGTIGNCSDELKSSPMSKGRDNICNSTFYNAMNDIFSNNSIRNSSRAKPIIGKTETDGYSSANKDDW